MGAAGGRASDSGRGPSHAACAVWEWMGAPVASPTASEGPHAHLAGLATLWEVTKLGPALKCLAKQGLESQRGCALRRHLDSEQDLWDVVPAMLLTCSVTLGKAFTFSGPQFSYQLCASQNGESLVQVIFRAAQLGRGGAIPAQTSPLLVSGWRTPFPVLTLHQPIWGLFPVSYGHLMERLLGLSFSTATSPQYGNNCFSILVLGTLSFKIFLLPIKALRSTETVPAH